MSAVAKETLPGLCKDLGKACSAAYKMSSKCSAVGKYYIVGVFP